MPTIPDQWRSEANSCQDVYGVPWQFSLAVAIHESGWGTSEIYRRHGNPFGIHLRGKPVRFGSLASAWEAFGERFAVEPMYRNAVAVYREQGLSTEFIEAWAAVYCPNTPKHPDQSEGWALSVERLVNQLGADEYVKLRG